MESENIEFVGDKEEKTACTSDPDDDAEASQQLSAQECSSLLATVEDTFLLVEEGDYYNSEDTAASVNLEGIKWVVNLESLHGSAGQGVGQGTEDSNHESGPWCNDIATGGDGYKPGKNTVGQGWEIHSHGGTLSSNVLLGQEGENSGGCWGDNSVNDGDFGGGSTISDDSGRRASVEHQPSEPENEGSHDALLRAVRSEFSLTEFASVVSNEFVNSVDVPFTFFILCKDLGISIDVGAGGVNGCDLSLSCKTSLLVNFWESTDSWSSDDGTSETSYSTGQMDDTRTCKILIVPGTEPATSPGPCDDYWVDEAGTEEGEEQVCVDLDSLGERSGDDSGSRASESILEEPHGVVHIRTSGEEVLTADEASIDIAEGKSITACPPNESTDASIHAVFKQNVLVVFESNGSSLKQCKSSLHEKDYNTREQKPGVDGSRIQGLEFCLYFFLS